MKSNKALVVDFALTDREEEEPEEGEEGAEVIDAEGIESSEEGLSANASKVQELADTLASEIEAEGIAASGESSEDENNDEDDDI
jgi:DNA gyrase subunit A